MRDYNTPDRALIRGWRHSPSNRVEIAGKLLNFVNWRQIETDEGEKMVCDVEVGDPERGGMVYDEVHPDAAFGKQPDFAGMRVPGLEDDRVS